MELWVGRGGVLDVLADRSWVRTVDLVFDEEFGRCKEEEEDTFGRGRLDCCRFHSGSHCTTMDRYEREKHMAVHLSIFLRKIHSRFTRCLRVVKPEGGRELMAGWKQVSWSERRAVV
eukprot:TRINITY_DN3997_c0_g1_i3.p2 TRINITY_DN3997_c0_g1~~TRINITY_DN3997_c0_g1_i3.p2  ORF type:complete len:117 (+),score=22.53 TRINITY_DN3997_c0_g1_i3:552-902(+)